MRYMMLIHHGEAALAKAPPSLWGDYAAFNEAAAKAGISYEPGNRLQPSSAASTVRVAGDKTAILDGPYADTKEQLAGYFMIDVPDLDQAIGFYTKLFGTTPAKVRPGYANFSVADPPLKLILIAGGDTADVARAEPILKLLGNEWKYTGGVGTAKVVKIVNNMMSMGNVLVAAEAFALGVAAGVEPEKLYDVLSVSGGRSHHFTKRFPNAIKGDFSPGFKMELGEKDLALGIELGRVTRMPTPSASATRELYALALAEGFRGQDIVSLLAMYQNWAKPKN